MNEFFPKNGHFSITLSEFPFWNLKKVDKNPLNHNKDYKAFFRLIDLQFNLSSSLFKAWYIMVVNSFFNDFCSYQTNTPRKFDKTLDKSMTDDLFRWFNQFNVSNFVYARLLEFNEILQAKIHRLNFKTTTSMRKNKCLKPFVQKYCQNFITGPRKFFCYTLLARLIPWH